MHMNTAFNMGDIMPFDNSNSQENSNFHKTEDDGSIYTLSSEDTTVLAKQAAETGNDPKQSEVCIMYICVATCKHIAI